MQLHQNVAIDRGSIDNVNLLWIAGILFGTGVVTFGALCENNREIMLQRMRAMQMRSLRLHSCVLAIVLPSILTHCLTMTDSVVGQSAHFAWDSLGGTLARDHQSRAMYYAGEHQRTYVAYMDHSFYARIT